MADVRGTLLGIDHGDKIIGIALCDGLWMAARPLEVYTRRTRAEDFAHIEALIEKHQCVGVVVGLPQMTNADDSFQGVSKEGTVHRWATRLAAAISVPVYGWNESLSTFEAELMTDELGLERRTRIDDRAAAIILQRFIDAHPEGAELPAPVSHRKNKDHNS
jgi:putative holliday junction resolvase